MTGHDVGAWGAAKRLLRGFTRLMRNERGNTFLITAAITLPLLLLVGSGIDLSRYYMTRNKLQQACDAGVLAGRKVYTGSVDATVTSEVQKYVNFDYPQGTDGTAPFTITPTNGGAGSSVVNLALSTTIPMSIMKLTGFTTLPVNVTCTGRQDFVNTDVVLVLDNTGSMVCTPSETSCSHGEQSDSKIAGLRSAVTAFYNALKPAQDQLEAAGLRLRYGIVPFSSNVNIGKLLLDTNPSWLYQSGYYRQCQSWYSGYTNVYCQTAKSTYTKVDHGAVSTSTAWWNNWANQNVDENYNPSASGYPRACIEERKTVNTIDGSSGYTPPANAYDLDLNMVPSGSNNPTLPNTASSPLIGNGTAWQAFDPANETAKANITGGFACPYPALQLQRIADVATINNYTANLHAVGGTYHDVGLIWGGRMLSQTGLWASNNPVTYNSFPVNRHIIFMTDGALDPDRSIYSAYGVEQFDKRVTPTGASDTTQYNSHLQRFRMMCNAIKGSNTTIWVIAFGNGGGFGLSADMINCASGTANAFKADDQAALIAQFTQIGQSIGALRLSQ